MGFAYDLEDIGHHIVDYQNFMSHWHKVLPGRVLNVHYEDIVDNPETNIRRMLDYVGLTWDDQVLSHHTSKRPVKTASVLQVRQPIYKTSKARWRNYAEFLEPLEAILARNKSTNR